VTRKFAALGIAKNAKKNNYKKSLRRRSSAKNAGDVSDSELRGECACLCVSVSVSVSVCIGFRVYLHTCVCVSVFACMHIYVYDRQ